MTRRAKIMAVLGLLALCGTVWGIEPIPNLISHWTFDEGEGDIAYDSFGDNDGTIYGATWTTGQIGGALSFDGVDDYVEIADDDSLTPEDQITVSFWTYRTVGGGATINKYAKCPNESASPGNSRAYTIIISGETNKVSVYICSSVNNVDSLESNNIIPLNEWHYITVTFNHGDAAIYIDGQLDISETMSVTSIMNDHHPLTIGAFWSYCGVDHLSTLMHGQIDEVSIYNRALSAEEIKELYEDGLDKYELAVTNIQRAIAEKAEALDRSDAALEKEWAAYEALEELLESGDYGDLKKGDIIKAEQKIHSAIQHEEQSKDKLEKSIEKLEDALAMLGWEPPVPVSHWALDEDSGDIAYDSAGDNDGTIYGAVWTTGQINGALSFDGDDDYVDIPYAPSLDIDASDGITVSAWIKLDSYPDSTHQAPVFGLFDSMAKGTKNYLLIGKAIYGNKITWDQYPQSWGFLESIKPDLDEWYHVVAVQNSTYRAIYINGVLDTSDNSPEPYNGSPPDTIRIGSGADGLASFYFDGIIDDVRIYERALSGEEIRLLYYNRLD